MKAIYLEVSANVRYWEDASVNGVDDVDGKLIPMRDGDLWKPIIRLSDGMVLDWPEGTVADVHYKMCDGGEYWLLDMNHKRIAKWKSYYVPDDLLCMGERGYGDYIILKINERGFIDEWEKPYLQDDEWEIIVDGQAAVWLNNFGEAVTIEQKNALNQIKESEILYEMSVRELRIEKIRQRLFDYHNICPDEAIVSYVKEWRLLNEEIRYLKWRPDRRGRTR